MQILAVGNTANEISTLHKLAGEAFPGCSCEAYLDPLLAIKSYQQKKPDLTIFNLSMQKIDGFTFTRTLRLCCSDFTGLMLAEDDSCRRDAGNFQLSFLVKPITALQLREVWARLNQ